MYKDIIFLNIYITQDVTIRVLKKTRRNSVYKETQIISSTLSTLCSSCTPSKNVTEGRINLSGKFPLNGTKG